MPNVELREPAEVRLPEEVARGAVRQQRRRRDAKVVQAEHLDDVPDAALRRHRRRGPALALPLAIAVALPLASAAAATRLVRSATAREQQPRGEPRGGDESSGDRLARQRRRRIRQRLAAERVQPARGLAGGVGLLSVSDFITNESDESAAGRAGRA